VGNSYYYCQGAVKTAQTIFACFPGDSRGQRPMQGGGTRKTVTFSRNAWALACGGSDGTDLWDTQLSHPRARRLHTGSVHKERHSGDLGNIEAGRWGKALYNRLDNRISLSGRNPIMGPSIMVKKKAADFKTRPGGAAGARIACGVIGISSLEADCQSGKIRHTTNRTRRLVTE
jgi:hypothetical protein